MISGAFLAPYAVSLYWKKVNKYGAWASMLGGFFVALPPLVAKLADSDITIGQFGKLCDLGPHFACLAMVASLILIFAVSALTNAFSKSKKVPQGA